MPVLKYLADTNAISDYLRGVEPVRQWFARHQNEIGLSTLTLAEMRAGIELKCESKARRKLERDYRFILEDYRGAIFVFDEAAAVEWGRLMVETRHHRIPYDDSLIAAIARAYEMHEMRVVTRNRKHFPRCATVNPWTGEEFDPWLPGLQKPSARSSAG